MTLPRGWIEAELSDVLDQLRTGPFGSVIHKHEYVRDGIPLVNPMHIVDGEIHPSPETSVSSTKALQLRDFRLSVNDVVLGRRGEMGRCAVIGERESGWLIGTGSMSLTPSEAVSAHFLKKFLSSGSVVAALEGDAIGSTMINLNQSILLRLPIALPPPAEQRRIVAKLDALTARLARARADLDRVPVLTEGLRRAALDSAMSGKLTPDMRVDEAAGNSCPMPPLDDQERGVWKQVHLPSHWSWAPFNLFLCDITDSKRKLPEKQYHDAGRFPVIDQGKAHVGGYTDNDELVHRATSSVVVFGDHTLCVKLVSPPFVQGADGVKVLAPAPGVDVAFARYALLSVDIPAKGYSRHMKFVRKTIWPLPPLSEQVTIVRRLNAIFARADRLEAEAARARALIDRLEAAILAKAFRGELVPQDPNDEPASVLLERIRARRAEAPSPKRGRRSAAVPPSA